MRMAAPTPIQGITSISFCHSSQTRNRRGVDCGSIDRELRADGVRVSVFKQQTAPKGGTWVDAQVDPRTNIDIENAILTRARQLRIAGGS